MSMATMNGTAQVEYQGTGSEMQVRVLPRRVLKWLQSLKLSAPIGKSPRRELANGFAVVEILSRFGFREKEEEIRVESFENEFSLDRKIANWDRIRKMLVSKGMSLPDQLIDAVIHTKNGAAEALLQVLHARLTGENSELPQNFVFDDMAYQSTLPPHARSTVASTISANMRTSELVSKPNKLEQTKAVEGMIAGHRHQDSLERTANPGRFDRTVLDATGHPQAPVPPVAPPSSRRDTGQRRSKLLSQRMNTASSPSRTHTAPQLTPLKTPTSPSLAGLSPLKITKRLDDTVA